MNRSICIALSILMAVPAFAGGKDVEVAVNKGEVLFGLISGEQKELAIPAGMQSWDPAVPVGPYTSIRYFPYTSIQGTPQAAGMSTGAVIGVEALATAIAFGIMNASMRNHYFKMQRKRMAPILNAVDEANLYDVMTAALAAEMASVYGKKADKVFTMQVFQEDAFFDKTMGKKKGVMLRLRPSYEFAKDKRDVRVKLEVRALEYSGGRGSTLRSFTVYAQSQPVAARSESVAIDALAKEGAALFKSELGDTARRALRAALLEAKTPEAEDETAQVETAFMNPKLSMIILGRVLKQAPDELVVDDGKGSTVLVFPVDRYLAVPKVAP